jgi:predicted TIM-barrel enzyme
LPPAAHDRQAVLARLREKVDRGEPILGGGAGNGLSAKAQELGGIDLLVIYNSGRYRMAGRGSRGGRPADGHANPIGRAMGGPVGCGGRRAPQVAGG